ERNIKKNLRNGDFAAISTATRERHAINKNIEKDFIMSMNRINTNLQSMTAQSSLNKINNRLGNTQQQLSTGLRINRAEDDAAGFSIASKLTSRIEGLDQSIRNVGDAKSVLDIAETGMNSIMDILVDMKGKAVQASNDTLGEEERGFIMEQLKALGGEINSIAGATTFQGMDLLSGEAIDPVVEGVYQSDGTTVVTDLETTAGEGYDFSESVSEIYNSNGSAYSITDILDAVNDDGLVQLHTSDGEELVDAANTGNNAFVELSTDAWGVVIEDDGGAPTTDITDLTIGTAGGTAITSHDELLNEDGEAIFVDGGSADAVQAFDENGDAIVDGDGDEVYITYNASQPLELDFQVGERAVDQLSIELSKLDMNELGGTYTDTDGNAQETSIAAGLGALTSDDTQGFNNFIDVIDGAIEDLAGNFNQIGMDQTKLSIREENLDQSITSSSAARSRIQDADFASAQSESIRLQILQQTAISSLAQANSSAQSVLGFLQ
ncbi:MAG: flagellin, partial [Balneolales bacterium]